MKDKLQFYINGAWVESDSSERIEVINPANEEIVGHVTAGTAADIDKAVQAANKAFKTYQDTSRDDRIEILNNIITEYENRYDDFVQTITEEMTPDGEFNGEAMDSRLTTVGESSDCSELSSVSMALDCSESIDALLFLIFRKFWEAQ